MPRSTRHRTSWRTTCWSGCSNRCSRQPRGRRRGPRWGRVDAYSRVLRTRSTGKVSMGLEQLVRVVPADRAQPVVPQVKPGKTFQLVGIRVRDVREVAAEQYLP